MKRALLVIAGSLLLVSCANVSDAEKLTIACDGFQAASIGLELYQAEKGSLDSTALAVVTGVHAVVDPICNGAQPVPTDLASTITLIEQSGLRMLSMKPVVAATVSTTQ